MLTFTLVLMNAALLAIAVRAMVKQAKAERAAGSVSRQAEIAKEILNSVVGKPIMVRTDVNQKRNFFMN